MVSQDVSDIVRSLRLFYEGHSEDLRDAGYSPEEAFWISFACLPFLPWNKRSEHKILLSQALRLYLSIYLHDIDRSMNALTEPDFLELLRDRYYKVKDMVSTSDPSGMDLGSELGSFILRGSNTTQKQLQAGLIVLYTKHNWDQQKGVELLPCEWVEDV